MMGGMFLTLIENRYNNVYVTVTIAYTCNELVATALYSLSFGFVCKNNIYAWERNNAEV